MLRANGASLQARGARIPSDCSHVQSRTTTKTRRTNNIALKYEQGTKVVGILDAVRDLKMQMEIMNLVLGDAVLVALCRKSVTFDDLLLVFIPGPNCSKVIIIVYYHSLTRKQSKQHKNNPQQENTSCRH